MAEYQLNITLDAEFNSLADWLSHYQLMRLLPIFEANAVGIDILSELTAADLIELGLPLGDRKRVLKAIEAWTGKTSDTKPTTATAIGEKAIGAERRQVTVFFCDLVGSSKLTATRDPEETRTIIRSYRDIVAASISQFDGHIAQFLGDGVLAYFGWPTAREDSALRAVTAALDVTKAIATFKPDQSLQLSVRIGIATGIVVVGAGDQISATEDQTAVGEVVNIAARLQEVAAPGSVVVAESTRQLLGDKFCFNPFGTRKLQGVGEVTVFTVTANDGDSGRTTNRRRVAATALFGREKEIRVAERIWAEVGNKNGSTLVISGEAGIGKSHLTNRVERLATDTGGHVVHYHCSPFQMSTALHPLINTLQISAGIVTGDSSALCLSKLEHYVASEGGDLATCMPYLSRLLALPTENYPEPDGVTPMIRKARTFSALTSLIAARAKHSEVLLVIEDAHWIDPTTLEFLDQLSNHAQALPVLVLINARLEFQPPWQGMPNFTHIKLQRVTDDEVMSIIMMACGGKSLPPAIMRRIAERSDGIPLFIEELTKAVIESGQLHETDGRLELTDATTIFSVPSSLRDTLMARLDRHPKAREIAQVAACIGRECDHDMLAAILDKNVDQLNDGLTKLCEAEILFQQSQSPLTTYVFKHALVQEAARESLLNSKKRQVHLQIATYLEQHRADFAAARPELLAYHLTESQAYEKAIYYRQKAGNLALASSGNLEAIGEFSTALNLITLLPQSEKRDRLELEVLITQAIPFTLTKGYAALEVETVYKRAMETCARLSEDQQSFAVIYGFWRFYLLRADYANAQNLSDQLIRMAHSSGSVAEMVTSNRASGATRFYTARYDDALLHLSQTASIEPLVELRKAILAYDVVDPWVVNHAYSGMALWIAGRPTEAKRQNEMAIALAREINHPFTLALALCFAQWTYQFCGDRTRVGELASEAIELSERYSFTFWRGWAEILLAWAEADGDHTKTRIRMKAGLVLWQSTGSELGLSYFQCLLAEYSSGMDVVLLLDAAEKFARERNETFWLPEIHRHRGRHVLVDGNDNADETAKAAFQLALETAGELGAKSLALRAAVELARFHENSAQHQLAQELVAQHVAAFTDSDSFDDLDLARLALQRAGVGRTSFDETH